MPKENCAYCNNIIEWRENNSRYLQCGTCGGINEVIHTTGGIELKRIQ